MMILQVPRSLMHLVRRADTESSSDVLSEVLKLPEPKPSKKKRQGINCKAIHITDNDFLSELKDKENERSRKKSKKEERERRKVEREKKKAERLQKRDATAKKERGRKPRRASMIEAELKKLAVVDQSSNDCTDSESTESDAQCPVCGITYLGDDSHSVWVLCDACLSWLDFKCTGLTNPSRLPQKYLCK